MTKPIDVPTRETAAFVASCLPAGAAVIEVGCGEGHVGQELLRRGFHAAGVDSDGELVAQARARGVPAALASWPDFESDPVDAVVFTRSLHHIPPLGEAVRRARDLLRPAGVLLVEDFAFLEADDATLDWFVRVLGSRTGRSLILPVAGELVTDLLTAGDRMAAWRASHDDGIHTMAAMSRAIAERFTIRETRSAPYLYRYLVPVLPETTEAATFVEDVLREERRMGERGEAVLIGRRLVGTRSGHPRGAR